VRMGSFLAASTGPRYTHRGGPPRRRRRGGRCRHRAPGPAAAGGGACQGRAVGDTDGRAAAGHRRGEPAVH
jgi:hypothetical protein